MESQTEEGAAVKGTLLPATRGCGYGQNEISKEVFDTLECFELMLAEHPHGVKASEVYEKFFPHQDSTSIFGRVRVLMEEGLLMRMGVKGSKTSTYILPDGFEERKARMKVHQRRCRDKMTKSRTQKPLVEPAEAEQLPLVKGFPYKDAEDLHRFLIITISALEEMQEAIPKLLPLLLDVEREFDRYLRVRGYIEKLLGTLKEPI
jgi:hypothetical protein